MAQYSKAVVIGLDGADWRLLCPWIERGELPTLSGLISEGCSGGLRSTIRPESSVAWSSFSTGVNPGKHGVFAFAERAGKGYGFDLANASSVRIRRFWDILGKHGLKVGMLNIPFTFPPSVVNGFLVTGMLTPGPDVSFTYPEELQGRLLRRFQDYAFDTGDSSQDGKALVDKVRAVTQQQRDTALFLMQEQPWDFFAMVFTGPDRLQHFLWADGDPQHPLHNPEAAQGLENALLEHYRVLDDAVAAILERVTPDTLVMVMSDHGFNGCARRFYVNGWLEEQGLLKLKETRNWRSGLAALLPRLGSVRWLRRLKRAILPDRWSSLSLQSAALAQTIDWAHTRAFFGLDGGLRINLQGREPKGCVGPGEAYESFRQELRQALLAVIDPETKKNVLSDVFLREELYHGRFVGQAPDLMLEPQRDNADPAHNFVLDGSLNAGRASVFGSSAPYSANHALDGILIARGPGVAQGTQISGAQIIDLAPTVLAVLDVAIPEYMDGNVLSEMFVPGCAPIPRTAPTPELDEGEKSARRFSPEEEVTVEARLRDLGYLD